MTKFLKLENGDYVNVDQIIKIEHEKYEYLYGDKKIQKSDDNYILVLPEPTEYISVNKRDVDAIMSYCERITLWKKQKNN